MLNIGRLGVFPDWGSALQIPQLGLLSQFWVPWYEAFFHRYIGSDLFLSLGASPDTTKYLFNDASLTLVGVRYIVVDVWNERAISKLSGLGYQIIHRDALRLIFENPHALARSFSVREVHTLDGLPSDIGADVLHSATTTDPTLLSELNGLGITVDVPATTSDPKSSPLNTVQVTAYHHDRVHVRCNLKEPALLVLTDSWNPRWSATIDQKPAYIGKVDVAFRGVAVAAGQHEVEFRYYPASRLLGQVISGITGICLLLGLWYWRKSLQARCTASETTKDVPSPANRHGKPPRRSRRST
jgi:hypothetical protein